MNTEEGMIKVSIAGGTGYTAGELLRILLNHPRVKIELVTSTTSAGTPVAETHRDLLGETTLKFSEETGCPDVLFLCLGHGLSREYLLKNRLPSGCRVIDLGNDFRNDPVVDGREFVFGLSELNHEKIRYATYVANPGCFATTILLALLPLADKDLLRNDIHIHALTGSTGAGKKPAETTHFSYRDGNISVHKPFAHQHLEEIGRTLKAAGAKTVPSVLMIPVRGDYTRGIFASIYMKWDAAFTEDEVVELFHNYYHASPFVFVSDRTISLKEVVNTNKCLLHIEFHRGYIHITSITDNLLKGASGQAVQNMNIMMGLDESTGLKLKGSAF